MRKSIHLKSRNLCLAFWVPKLQRVLLKIYQLSSTQVRHTTRKLQTFMMQFFWIVNVLAMDKPKATQNIVCLLFISLFYCVLQVSHLTSIEFGRISRDSQGWVITSSSYITEKLSAKLMSLQSWIDNIEATRRIDDFVAQHGDTSFCHTVRSLIFQGS